MHSREIRDYGGVAEKMPLFAFFFMIFTLASVALPATSAFVGEFLVLLGAFKENVIVAILASTGVILGAAYMLLLYRKVMLGTIINEAVNSLQDLDYKEIILLSSLALMVIFIGIYPTILLDYISVSVSNLIKSYF